MVEGKGILTRADLPTPPEPNTTSLYSRMARWFHQTAQQTAVNKQVKAKKKKRWGNKISNVWKESETQVQQLSSLKYIYMYLYISRLVAQFSSLEKLGFYSFLELMDKTQHNNRGNTHSGWRRWRVCDPCLTQTSCDVCMRIDGELRQWECVCVWGGATQGFGRYRYKWHNHLALMQRNTPSWVTFSHLIFFWYCENKHMKSVSFHDWN